MQILLLILVAIIFALVSIVISRGNYNLLIKEKRNDIELPYEKKPYLMTNAEREFFFVLERAVQGRYYVVPQVQLSKIVQVEKKNKWKYKYNNFINLKSVDFVLFDKEYFTPQIIIELDDSSHLLDKRKGRDDFVNSLIQKVGIKFIRIPVSNNYNIDSLIN